MFNANVLNEHEWYRIKGMDHCSTCDPICEVFRLFKTEINNKRGENRFFKKARKKSKSKKSEKRGARMNHRTAQEEEEAMRRLSD